MSVFALGLALLAALGALFGLVMARRARRSAETAWRAATEARAALGRATRPRR